MFCSDLTLVSQATSGIKATPLFCNSWNCEHCAEVRRRKLKREAREGRPNRFITLTCNPSTGGTPDERARTLVKAWRMLRQKLIRHGYAKHIPFMAVFERTKKGEPHLHILARAGYIPQRFISEFMRSYMQAPIVDIRKVDSAKAVAGYVAKYISKTPHAFNGCKRYWRSITYITPRSQLPKKKVDVVAILRRCYTDVCEDIVRGGITIADDLKGGAIRIGWHTGQWKRYVA